MKKTLIILIIVVVGIMALYAAYVFGYKQGKNAGNTNASNAQSEKSCNTDQDCVKNGTVCTGENQPTCMKINLATGEEYHVPKCMCLNPNTEY